MNLAFLAPQHPPRPAQPFVRAGESRNEITVVTYLTFQWWLGNYTLNHDILNWSGAIISSTAQPSIM